MSGSDPGPLFVGVLHAVLAVPGARTLKDTRVVSRSIRDRVRHRYSVSYHDVPQSRRDRFGAIVTTAGNDQRKIRSILDKIRGYIESRPEVVIARVDVDVFRWHPPHRATYDVADYMSEPEEEHDG